ncbi:hypothetical protein GTY44_28995, partial [Streptomyces sp. SID5914]|nr:hypothetical protein [Streptomyces sp. SID5914]
GAEGPGDGAATTATGAEAGNPAPWAGPAAHGATTAPAPRAPASPVARSVRSHGVTSVTPSR